MWLIIVIAAGGLLFLVSVYCFCRMCTKGEDNTVAYDSGVDKNKVQPNSHPKQMEMESMDATDSPALRA